MTQKKTHDEAVEQLAERRPDVEAIGEYLGSKTPFHCNWKLCDCTEPWFPKFNNLMNGAKCAHCKFARRKPGGKKTSPEEFAAIVDARNPHLEMKSEYTSCFETVLVNDTRCDCPPYEAIANELTRKNRPHGCAHCRTIRNGRSRLIQPDEFLERLATANPEAILLEPYTGIVTPVLSRFANCDCPPVLRRPSDLVRGMQCGSCGYERAGEKRRTPPDVWENRMADKFPHIRLTIKYTHSQDLIGFTDDRCNCPEQFLPAYYLKRIGRCPNCFKVNSKGEILIAQWLVKQKIKFETQVMFDGCKHKYRLRFDFLVDDVLIEYDGIYHYEVVPGRNTEKKLALTKRRDSIKNQWAADNGYRLIRIPYWNRDKIESILESAFA